MTDNPEIPRPHAPMAEKAILSCMFQEPSRIARAAAEGIDAEAFHIPAHRTMLSRLIIARDGDIMDESGRVELVTFVQSAHIDGLLDRMGGAAAIMEVYGYATSPAGWSAWCDQLRECKARRIALEAADTLAGDMDSGDAINAATDALERMKRAITAKTRSLNAKQACDEFISGYVASYENGDLPGTSTGIGEIDAITGGAKPGELWTVGGPSSSGKSVLMYQIASEFIGDGKIVAIFSAELMAREIVGRLVCLKARVTYDAITTPRDVSKSEMVKVQQAIGDMAKTRMWIDASAGQSLDTIASESERIKDIEGKVDLIVVDYIQIVRGNRNKGDSREQEVASISGGLKQLAKKMGCPVITGSQLNDDGKTRESRAIEQDSDVMMLIQDDGIKMKKVRNGQRDSLAPLTLDGSSQRFRYFQQ